MPSTVAESDTYSANVQRPNNGELADAASILQGLQPLANRTNWLKNRALSGIRDVTPFNADPTGAADSKAAIQNAIDAVHGSPSGFGTVRLPGGAYKLNTGLTLYRGVSLVGDGAILYLNNVSDYCITLDVGTALGVPRYISGIAFEALVPTSGEGIFVTADATPRDVVISDCSFNWASQNYAGSFLSLPSAATANIVVARCKAKARANGASLIYVNGGSDSHLEVAGGLYSGPAGAYATSLVSLVDTPADVHGARFTLAGHGTGTAYCVETSGLSAKKLRGNTFFQSGAGANIKAAGRLVEEGSDHTGGTRYDVTTALTTGSRLDLQRVISATSGGPGPFNIDALGLGIRTLSYILTGSFGGGGPTFAMPTILFEGQRFTLTVANKTGGNWNGIVFTGGGQGNAGATNDNRGRTFEFVATDFSGGLAWIVESDVTYDWIA